MEENKIAAISVDGGRCRLWQSEKGKKLHDSQWKEAKLGCMAIYTLEKDEKGEAKNKLKHKEYIGRVNESSNKFGKRMYHETLLRGYESIKHKVFLADGAKYNWEIQQTHFGTATPILDWYHATEHLAAAGKELYDEKSKEFNEWIEHDKSVLFEDDFFYLDELLSECKNKVKSKAKKKNIAKERKYFWGNRQRIRYRYYREAGLPLSSCLIESGMKITVNERIKGSEKHWHRKYANYVLSLKIAEVNDGQQKLGQMLKIAA